MNINDYVINKVGDDEGVSLIEVVKEGVTVTTGRYDEAANYCALNLVDEIIVDEFELVKAIEQKVLTVS